MKHTTSHPLRRRLVWSLLALLAVALCLPLVGMAQVEEGVNQRAEFWRAVRGGTEGYTAVRGPETDVLIQNGGENWRALRNGPVKTYGALAIGAMVFAIIVFALRVGRVKLARGRSGMTVPRWSVFERTLHWYTATLFILLALTGLSLLYGRHVLIPLLGKDTFAAYAAFAKDAHNYLGLFFAVGLLLEIVKWMRHNIPKRHDLTWFMQGGGLIGKGHPSAGRMNAGEKGWFWLLAGAGTLLIISGVVLNFPNYGQTRDIMQIATLTHAAMSLILTAVAIGHIYIGTLGTEGSLDAMTTGRVDTEWAKQHHDLWYEELLAQGVELQPADRSHPRAPLTAASTSVRTT